MKNWRLTRVSLANEKKPLSVRETLINDFSLFPQEKDELELIGVPEEGEENPIPSSSGGISVDSSTDIPKSKGTANLPRDFDGNDFSVSSYETDKGPNFEEPLNVQKLAIEILEQTIPDHLPWLIEHIAEKNVGSFLDKAKDFAFCVMGNLGCSGASDAKLCWNDPTGPSIETQGITDLRNELKQLVSTTVIRNAQTEQERGKLLSNVFSDIKSVNLLPSDSSSLLNDNYPGSRPITLIGTETGGKKQSSPVTDTKSAQEIVEAASAASKEVRAYGDIAYDLLGPMKVKIMDIMKFINQRNYSELLDRFPGSESLTGNGVSGGAGIYVPRTDYSAGRNPVEKQAEREKKAVEDGKRYIFDALKTRQFTETDLKLFRILYPEIFTLSEKPLYTIWNFQHIDKILRHFTPVMKNALTKVTIGIRTLLKVYDISEWEIIACNTLECSDIFQTLCAVEISTALNYGRNTATKSIYQQLITRMEIINPKLQGVMFDERTRSFWFSHEIYNNLLNTIHFERQKTIWANGGGSRRSFGQMFDPREDLLNSGKSTRRQLEKYRHSRFI